MFEQDLAPLFMIGGTDGSGKGLVVDTLVKLLREEWSVFDHREYEKEHTFEKNGVLYLPSLPKYNTVSENQIFVAAEPTKSETGYAVREVLKDPNHTAPGVAEGFSFDRYSLDTRLTTPLRKSGIPVVKERGVESSLVYQPAWSKYNGNDFTEDDILALDGNKNAFERFPPTHLLICHCPVEVSVDRLKSRDKKDDAAYEKKRDFMKIILDRYLSTEIRNLFEEQGVKVMYLDTNTASPEATIEKLKQDVWPIMKEDFERYINK
jgi:thymidylate kinase